MKEPRDIIKRPIVTEKATFLKESGWISFAVARRANKKEIKEAVEKIFKVKVDTVRTLTMFGKVVTKMGKPVGKKSAVKKAYVKLKEGKIEFFEGV